MKTAKIKALAVHEHSGASGDFTVKNGIHAKLIFLSQNCGSFF